MAVRPSIRPDIFGPRPLRLLAGAAAVLAGIGAASPAGAQGGFPFVCAGGGGMVGTVSDDGTVRVTFSPALAAAATASPGPGECAFLDRPLREGEPTLLLSQGDPTSAHILVDMIISGNIVSMRVFDDTQGAMVITSFGQ